MKNEHADLIEIIFRIIDSTIRFRECKKDEYTKATVVRYGVFSIVAAVCYPIVLTLCVMGLNAVFAGGAKLLFTWVLVLFLAIFAIYCFFWLGVGSLINAIRQLQLDKKVTGIIGLPLSLLSLASTVLILSTLAV